MATDSRDGIELLIPKKNQNQETSPGTIKKQNQPQPIPEKKVAVVYYLSRNGQFEHPHFVEVPLSSPQGLYLRDVMKTLNLLRGQGMASMYSWASKRSYKNGYIWQDLSDDDFIYPCHGQDYILKGSLLLETSLSFRSNESISSSTSRRSSEKSNSSSEDSNSPVTRRKNHSWISIDGVVEEKVYKEKTTGELPRKGSDVSTTDNNRKIKLEIEVEPIGLDIMKSSSKTSESLERSLEVSKSTNVRYQKVGRNHLSGRTNNDSKFLMKLIGCGCGSKRFKDFERMEIK